MLSSMSARKLSSLPYQVGTKPTSLLQKSSRSACRRILPLSATKPMIAPPSDRQRALRELKPAFLVALTARRLSLTHSRFIGQRIEQERDGSVDIYFGPKVPAGQESNWIYTRTEKS